MMVGMHTLFICYKVVLLGMLRYIDTRKPGVFVSEVLAHSDGTNDVSGSYKVKGLLTTAGSKVCY